MTHHIDTKAYRAISAFLGFLLILVSIASGIFRVPWRLELLEQQHQDTTKIIQAMSERVLVLERDIAEQAGWREQVVLVLTDIKTAVRDIERREHVTP